MAVSTAGQVSRFGVVAFFGLVGIDQTRPTIESIANPFSWGSGSGLFQQCRAHCVVELAAPIGLRARKGYPFTSKAAMEKYVEPRVLLIYIRIM